MVDLNAVKELALKYLSSSSNPSHPGVEPDNAQALLLKEAPSAPTFQPFEYSSSRQPPAPSLSLLNPTTLARSV
jgi:hypothetical protein